MAQIIYLIITYIMISCGFYATMQSFDLDKAKIKKGLGCLGTVIVADMAVMLLRTKYPFFNDLAIGWAYFLPLFIMCKGHFLAKLFTTASQHLLLTLMFMFSSFWAEIFYPYQSTGQLIVTLVLSLASFFGWAFLCRRYARKLSDRVFIFTQPLLWGVYILIPLMSLLIVGFYFFTTGLVWCPNPVQDPLQYLTLPILIVLCYVLLFATIISTHDKTIAQREIDLAHTTISRAHAQYDQLTSLIEDIRQQRHDNRFHMMTIKQLLRSGNTEEALKYVDTAETAASTMALPQYCVNPIINAVVSSIAEQCLSNGIDFSAEISLPTDHCPDEYELCAVLGNLLENAFIAASHTPKENKPYIDLNVGVKGAMFGIMCQNSFDGYIIAEDGNLKTTKKDPIHSGIGIASIKAIVKRYDGSFMAEYDRERFTAYVVFKDY